jgi:glycerol-3-phosphate acyltransferase PlsY
MSPLVAVIAVVVAYLVGTLPSAIIIARSKGVDITSTGSGNPGASNVARALGWKYGGMVFVLDAAKGALLVALTLSDRPVAYLCGAAAILGHIYPITRKLKGGKGIATAAGVLLPLHPLIMLGTMLTWILIAKVGKKASVASIVAVPLVTLALIVFGTPAWEIFSFIGIGILIEIRHLSNIKRLITGTEPPVSGASH